MRLIATGLLLGFSSASLAGVVMQMQDKDLNDPQAKPSTQTFYFQDGSFRTEQSDENQISLFRAQTMYMLDTEKKSYRKIDKAQMQQVGDQLAGMRQKMEEQMAKMSPEQRAMVESALGSAGAGTTAAAKRKAPVLSVRDTGRSDSAAGYSCRVWEILTDGKKEHEVCATAAGPFPGGNDMLKSMREIGDFLSGLASSFGGKGNAIGGYWSQIQQINGVPLITRDFDSSGKADSEMRVVAVKSENLPATLFAVPAGYTEKKLPNFGALGGGGDEEDEDDK
jgi:hypothetical protein